VFSSILELRRQGAIPMTTRRQKEQSAPVGRLWAYIRASTSDKLASPDIQKALLCERAQLMGRIIDGFYVDRAASGNEPMTEREAGKRLFVDMRPGDTILVARLDRLSRSFIDFTKILQSIQRRGCYLHILDIRGGVFDPSNPLSTVLIDILIAFAQYERTLIGTRTAEGLAAIRKRGERHTRHPHWGMKWEKRKDPRTGRQFEVMVACEKERAIMRRAVELRAQRYSLDEIRQHLSYDLKTTNRGRTNGEGGAWRKRDIAALITRGMELLKQETDGQGLAATPHR
jgi:DNA invertase Pin-like site-specific DNA recombinase